MIEWLLETAALALSIFVTVSFLWLGLTVLLNGDRRRPVTLIAAAGLLVGAVFFLSHTMILGRGLTAFGFGMDFWWRLAWASAAVAPAAWCLVALRYTQCPAQPPAGVDADSPATHRQRYRIAQVVLVLAGVTLIIPLTVLHPFSTYDTVLHAPRSASPWPGDIPLPVWLYIPYMAACYLVPLLALCARPAATATHGVLRMPEAIARRRARPWLAATSLLLLLVGLVVAVVGMWAAQNTLPLIALTPEARRVLFLGDLVVLTLVAVAVTLLGRTIVAYEVFTERPLPRRGFWRMWRGIVILAAGFAALVAFFYRIELRPIYSLVAITIVAGVAYALFSWQRYRDHEAFVAALRPFIASTGPHEQLLSDAPDAEASVRDLFRTLCRDVLDAERAGLLLVGPLEDEEPRWIGYRWDKAPTINLAMLAAGDDCLVRLDATAWALPLADKRGAVGALVLGPRVRGSDYTAEEMDVARAAGERILDVVAGAQVARLATDLLRQRITEAKVLGAQSKRVLHDEVLPQLHLALLYLSTIDSDADALAQAQDSLTQAHRTLSDLMRDMAVHGTLRVAAPHHLDRDGLTAALQRTLAHDFYDGFDAVDWRVGDDLPDLPPFVAEVVFYAAQEAVRNAARYGRGDDPARPLHLTVEIANANGLRVVVRDDGVGLRPTKQKLPGGLKPPGSDGGGSGTGLLFHRAMLAVVGGTLTVESRPGHGTTVVIAVPAQRLAH